VAGTTGFRAPEASLTQLSDLYALGALLRSLMPAPFPPALAAIAQKAMSDDVSARYPAITDFLADIDRFEQGMAVEAWSEPVWHRLRRFGSRNAVLVWLLVAYTLAKFLLFFLRKS